MSSAFRGVVAHGAGFSKHFAAFTLLGKDGVTYVDCALAGKDGWDVDVLRELCIALALPTQTTAVENALDTMTLHESSSKDSPAHVVVEVDILRCTYETIETHRPNGDEKFCETGGTRSSAHRCAHPLELRTRRQPSPNSTQDSGPWRTWRAVPKPEDDGKKTTEKPKHKDTRASCFAASLVKHFSLDGLKKGTGVIDVAGGSGDLSHELFYRYGIRCSIIDPRGEGVKVTSRRARLFKSRGENVSMIPETWRAVSPLATSLRDKWSTPDGKVAHIKLFFDVNLMHDPVTKNLLEEASAIVGLHPDQATGAIADCGLSMRKNWAVVPCCVFPETHPARLVPGTAKTVRTTAQLVKHLVHRAPLGAAVCETLSCDGANKAVFCVGHVFDDDDGDVEDSAENDGTGVLEGTADWPYPAPPKSAPQKGPFRLT